MKTFNIATHRHYDNNGFLYVDSSPVLKAGVLEYLGCELSDTGMVDGVAVEPEKVYKVYIDKKELQAGLQTFKLLPILNDHTWLDGGEGLDGEDAKGYQEGTTGEGVYISDGMLYAPLKFTGQNIIKDIEQGKVELSASYTNILKRASEGSEYDFTAHDLRGNHIALVTRGRCGADVRVLNTAPVEPQTDRDLAVQIFKILYARSDGTPQGIMSEFHKAFVKSKQL